MKNFNLKQALKLATLMAFVFMPLMANATIIQDTDAFYPLYFFVSDNLNGALGVAIALISFLISLVIAGVAQSGMPILIGFIVAIAISFGPGMLENMITEGAMIPYVLLSGM